MSWRLATHELKAGDSWVGGWRLMSWRLATHGLGWRLATHELEAGDQGWAKLV